MQIKVKDTRMHKTGWENPVSKRDEEVPVADAKLVLVECKPEEALIYLPVWKYEENKLRLFDIKDVHPSAIYKAYKPILISETEKVEEGNWVLGKDNTIFQWKTSFPLPNKTVFKILALPEHFSPKHLQAMVDGKLKEGKVAVETEYVAKSSEEIELSLKNKENFFYEVIKLNSSKHITLHKVEEKMYTTTEVLNLLSKFAEEHICVHCDEPWDFHIDNPNKVLRKWFEQNAS